jgi:DNA-binding transcriptional LysR family regulator
MTFQQLTYALEVARCTSINKAADQLYTHQSNVSNVIKQLEDELGVQIFLRSKKGIVVTEEGREFLSYAEDIVSRKAYIEELYQARLSKERIYLNVSSMRAFLLSIPFIRIQHDLYRFSDQSVYLRLKKQPLPVVLKDVEENRSSLGIVFVLKENRKRLMHQCKVANLTCTKLGESRICVVLKPDHPVLKEIDPLNHITEYPYVILEEKENFGAFYDESSRSIRQIFKNAPKCVTSVNDSQAEHEIVHETNAFFISSMPWQHDEHYHFASLPLPGDDNILEHYYLKRSDLDLPYMASLFEKELKNMFAKDFL